VAVVWTPEGADDFLAALAFLCGRNRAAASALSARVDRALRALDELPLDGPRTTLRGGDVVRGWPVPPLRVYYQRRGADVLVVRLYDQRREPIEEP
jgi:plasmid stabilization system protein ParE